MRPLRVVCGTLVPRVIEGSGPADKTLPVEASDRSHYHHPAVAVNEHEWATRWNRLRKVPLIIEHGARQKRMHQVGEVIDTTLQKDGSMYVVASVYDDETGAMVANEIESGQIRGFSVGYRINRDASGRRVHSKDIEEVSLVLRPFFPEAVISVCASDAASYNSDATQETDFVRLYDSSSMSDATPPRDPATETKTAAAEIELQRLREQLQEKTKQEQERAKQEAEKQKAIDAERAELERYRAERKAQQDRAAQEKQAEIKAALDEIKKGVGADLPEEWQRDALATAEAAVRLPEDHQDRASVVVASQMYTTLGKVMQTKEQETAALKKELDDLKAALAKKDQDYAAAADRVKASRDAIYSREEQIPSKDKMEQEETPVSVQASGGGGSYLHGSRLEDLIKVPRVKPNTREGNQYRDLYDRDFNVRSYNVTASGAAGATMEDTVTVPRLPEHKYLAHVPLSIRNRIGEDGVRYGEAWLKTMQDNYVPNAPTTAKFKIESDYKVERIK